MCDNNEVKVATSYFYQIRHFKQNMIPVSTAMWDPKWFHDWRGHKHTFLDKRGIVNGLRCEELHGDETCAGLCSGPELCDDVCPPTCPFLTAYKNQLMRMDFEAFMQRVRSSAAHLKEQIGFEGEPIVVFIVYETPKNKCSERVILQQFFNEHGVECNELKYPIKENYQ